jgi:putative transposase
MVSITRRGKKMVQQFANWYNNIHRHSRIGFVTPSQKHASKDGLLMQNRKTVYEASRLKNPLRWSGNTRSWGTISAVTLNPENQKAINQLYAA